MLSAMLKACFSFPGTANSSIKASSKLRRLSIVASLPVLVNVAVPQLVMKITAAQRKHFEKQASDSYGASFKLADLALAHIHVSRLQQRGFIRVRTR